jgi:hypothetical protein
MGIGPRARFHRLALPGLLAALFAVPSVGQALIVSWDIDPTQSSLTLTVPDQAVTVNGINATIQLRNANNTAWSQGRTAAIDGTLSAKVWDGAAIKFLTGQHAAVGVDSGSFRPNPAAFNPSSTNTANPAGQYTNTTTASAVYAAKVRANIGITADVGFVSFLDTEYDVASALLPIGGGGTFAGNALTLGVLDALIAFDGLSVIIVGQVIPDSPPTPLGTPVLGLNTAAGASVTAPDPIGDPLLRKLTIPVSVPLTLTLQGTTLNASAAGQIVAFGYVPEPTTIGLLGLGIAGLAALGRRRD